MHEENNNENNNNENNINKKPGIEKITACSSKHGPIGGEHDPVLRQRDVGPDFRHLRGSVFGRVHADRRHFHRLRLAVIESLGVAPRTRRRRRLRHGVMELDAGFLVAEAAEKELSPEIANHRHVQDSSRLAFWKSGVGFLRQRAR